MQRIDKNVKSFKIVPLIQKMNRQFLQFQVFSKHISTEEQMVRYYGHHYMKQFIRDKLIRFSFKHWAMCCGETGYCFHFELNEGKIETDFPVEVLGASVILKNISQVSDPSNHIFDFDSFFTTHTMMKYLREKI